MKRMVCLILMMLFLIPCCAGAEEYSEQLAGVIAGNGRIGLERVDGDISGYDVYCAKQFFSETTGMAGEESEDGLRVKMPGTAADNGLGQGELVAASPSGAVRVYRLSEMLAVAREGQLTLITPCPDRGAHNSGYEEATYGAYNRLGQMIEQDSIAWSPDERYFTLTFPNAAVMTMRFFDLMLVDAWTGELGVAVAQPKKMNQGGQTALCACFDAAGENVYYLSYGALGENVRCGIKRYNIASGEAELICGVENMYVDRPGIFMTGSGEIRGMTDVVKMEEAAGAIVFAQKDGAWDYTVNQFGFTLEYGSPVRYLYSETGNVEMAFIGSTAGYFMVVNTDAQGAPGQMKALMLPAEGNQAELIEVNAALMDTMVQPGWLNVVNACLSPDGRFALVMTNTREQPGLYVVDLQTLGFVPAEMPAEFAGMSKMLAAATAGRQSGGVVIDWLEDGSILIPAGSASGAYKLIIG